jgi:hypothetical protein
MNLLELHAVTYELQVLKADGNADVPVLNLSSQKLDWLLFLAHFVSYF